MTLSFGQAHIKHEQAQVLSIKWMKLNFMNSYDMNCWRIFIELILYRKLTLMRTTLCWRALGSWGPRRKNTKPIGKSVPGCMCLYYRYKYTSKHLACSRIHLNRDSILHSHVLVHLKFLRHSHVLRRPLVTEVQKMSITSITEIKLRWSFPSRSRTVRFKCTVCCAWWL